MNEDKEIFDALILSGLIGTSLEALITETKHGNALGALAGFAILASFRANQQAQKTNVPFLIVKNNALYEVQKNGVESFVRELPQQPSTIPQFFTLR